VNEDTAKRNDVRAAASPVRCPYCHADVDPESSEWVACRGCLARHHASCWGEHGTCAACGEDGSLSESAAPVPRTTPESQRSLAAIALFVASPVLAFITFVVLNMTAFNAIESSKAPTPADLAHGVRMSFAGALLVGVLLALAGVAVLVLSRRRARPDAKA
jgi:hypothetical protein